MGDEGFWTGFVTFGVLAGVVLLVTKWDGQNDHICTTPPLISPGESPAQCVHRWAFRLAQSTDTAREAADGAVGACSVPIKSEAEASNAANLAAGERQIDLRGWQEEISKDARREAIFRVVQARAGNCDYEPD